MLPRGARAQADWVPDRPLRLVVPSGPGGSQDVLGRLFAQAVAPELGQQVLVENRAGAGGLVGAEVVADATPDGTVLLLATAGQLTIPKALGRRLPYDPVEGFAPVIHLVDSPVVLLAAPNLEVTDARELLELARTTYIPLPYASTGIGTNTHLIMEDLKERAGLNVEHVPYRGAAAAYNDLLAGRIALMFVSMSSMLGISGGAPKVLAVTSRTRFPAAPDIPTLIEAGVPDFEASIWTGLCAPAGTPAPILARLAEAFGTALHSPTIQERLTDLGAVGNGGDGRAFAAMLRADLERWSRVAAPLHTQLN